MTVVSKKVTKTMDGWRSQIMVALCCLVNIAISVEAFKESLLEGSSLSGPCVTHLLLFVFPYLGNGPALFFCFCFFHGGFLACVPLALSFTFEVGSDAGIVSRRSSHELVQEVGRRQLRCPALYLLLTGAQSDRVMEHRQKGGEGVLIEMM